VDQAPGAVVLSCYNMSGAPPHLQGCNRLRLNTDSRNAFDNPVLRIAFPRSLASYRFMDLIPGSDDVRPAECKASFLENSLSSLAGSESSERHVGTLSC